MSNENIRIWQRVDDNDHQTKESSEDSMLNQFDSSSSSTKSSSSSSSSSCLSSSSETLDKQQQQQQQQQQLSWKERRDILKQKRDSIVTNSQKIMITTRSNETSNNHDTTTTTKKDLHLVVIGHLGSGKSTTVGGLICKSGGRDKVAIEHLAKEDDDDDDDDYDNDLPSRTTSKYCWILERLKLRQQEQLSKVSVQEQLQEPLQYQTYLGYHPIETPKYKVLLMDAPGDKECLQNMVVSPICADAVLLVVDASYGGFETGFGKHGQTTQHALLISVLGIKQIIVAVNKMDDITVNFAQDRYDEIKHDLVVYLDQLGCRIENHTPFIPISSRTGDNIMHSSTKMKWYHGPCLHHALDSLKAPANQNRGGGRGRDPIPLHQTPLPLPISTLGASHQYRQHHDHMVDDPISLPETGKRTTFATVPTTSSTTSSSSISTRRQELLSKRKRLNSTSTRSSTTEGFKLKQHLSIAFVGHSNVGKTTALTKLMSIQNGGGMDSTPTPTTPPLSPLSPRPSTSSALSPSQKEKYKYNDSDYESYDTSKILDLVNDGSSSDKEDGTDDCVRGDNSSEMLRRLSMSSSASSSCATPIPPTMDLIRYKMKTRQYRLTIMDTPGSTENINNMIVGVANSDAAVLVVDATEYLPLHHPHPSPQQQVQEEDEEDNDNNSDNGQEYNNHNYDDDDDDDTIIRNNNTGDSDVNSDSNNSEDEAEASARQSLSDFSQSPSNQQTRELALLTSVFGVRQVIVVVNKMDEIDYDEEIYEKVEHNIGLYLEELGYTLSNIKFIPTSSHVGDNILEFTTNMKWYMGPTLFEALDQLSPPQRVPRKSLQDLRVSLLDFAERKGVGTVVVGKVVCGTLRNGVVVKFPEDPPKIFGQEAMVTLEAGLEEASAGENVAFLVQPRIAIPSSSLERGQILSDPTQSRPARNALSFHAQVMVLNYEDNQMTVGQVLTLHCHSASVNCAVKWIRLGENDPEERRTRRARDPNRPITVTGGNACETLLQPLEGICLETYSDCTKMGRFVLRDNDRTVAVGVVAQVNCKALTNKHSPSNKYGTAGATATDSTMTLSDEMNHLMRIEEETDISSSSTKLARRHMQSPKGIMDQITQSQSTSSKFRLKKQQQPKQQQQQAYFQLSRKTPSSSSDPLPATSTSRRKLTLHQLEQKTSLRNMMCDDSLSTLPTEESSTAEAVGSTGSGSSSSFAKRTKKKIGSRLKKGLSFRKKNKNKKRGDSFDGCDESVSSAGSALSHGSSNFSIS